MPDERAANAVDRRLGQLVRARRLELGMSQQNLARALGITFQQVQKYERGVNRIAASRLYEIAVVLDTTVGQLFAELELEKQRNARDQDLIRAVLATKQGMELVLTFAKIKSRRLRKRILDLIKTMALGPPS